MSSGLLNTLTLHQEGKPGGFRRTREGLFKPAPWPVVSRYSLVGGLVSADKSEQKGKRRCVNETQFCEHGGSLNSFSHFFYLTTTSQGVFFLISSSHVNDKFSGVDLALSTLL